VLSREEFDQLLAAAPTHLRPILLTSYHTGMRKSEILNLRWDREDLKTGVIRLHPVGKTIQVMLRLACDGHGIASPPCVVAS
jgi:integrase